MKTILIIDDDHKIVLSLSVRLRASGYDVLCAYDGVMGTSTAVKHRPDLIILDISMPAGNGFSVAERLNSLPGTAGIPMIFMTASKQPEFKQKAMDLGAVAFFEKPYEPSELIVAIESATSEHGIQNNTEFESTI